MRALNERRRDEGPSSSGGSGAGKTAADKKKKKAHEEAKYLMKKKYDETQAVAERILTLQQRWSKSSNTMSHHKRGNAGTTSKG